MQARSLAEALGAARAPRAPVVMQNAGAASAAGKLPGSGDLPPGPPAVGSSNSNVVLIDGVRIKLADPGGAAGRMSFSSRAPSPEANAAETGIRVRIRYHAFYAQLGLGPEQIARFETAMREKNYLADVFIPLVGAPPDVAARYTESKMLALDEVVRETLGESQVVAMRRYVATAELQEIADKLAVQTFASESPLTAQQADQLVRTSLALRSNPDEPVTRVDPRTVDWDAVYRRAGEFLTSAQMTQLRAMLDQRKFDQDYSDVTGGARRPPVRNF